jgi:hypothetical protein
VAPPPPTSSCMLIFYLHPLPHSSSSSRSLESVDRDRSTKPPPPNNYAIVSADVSALSRGETDFVVRADMRPARLRLPAGEMASLVPPGAYIDASSFLTVSDTPRPLWRSRRYRSVSCAFVDVCCLCPLGVSLTASFSNPCPGQVLSA